MAGFYAGWLAIIPTVFEPYRRAVGTEATRMERVVLRQSGNYPHREGVKLENVWFCARAKETDEGKKISA